MENNRENVLDSWEEKVKRLGGSSPYIEFERLLEENKTFVKNLNKNEIEKIESIIQKMKTLEQLLNALPNKDELSEGSRQQLHRMIQALVDEISLLAIEELIEKEKENLANLIKIADANYQVIKKQANSLYGDNKVVGMIFIDAPNRAILRKELTNRLEKKIEELHKDSATNQKELLSHLRYLIEANPNKSPREVLLQWEKAHPDWENIVKKESSGKDADKVVHFLKELKKEFSALYPEINTEDLVKNYPSKSHKKDSNPYTAAIESLKTHSKELEKYPKQLVTPEIEQKRELFTAINEKLIAHMGKLEKLDKEIDKKIKGVDENGDSIIIEVYKDQKKALSYEIEHALQLGKICHRNSSSNPEEAKKNLEEMQKSLDNDVNRLQKAYTEIDSSAMIQKCSEKIADKISDFSAEPSLEDDQKALLGNLADKLMANKSSNPPQSIGKVINEWKEENKIENSQWEKTNNKELGKLLKALERTAGNIDKSFDLSKSNKNNHSSLNLN